MDANLKALLMCAMMFLDAQLKSAIGHIKTSDNVKTLLQDLEASLAADIQKILAAK